MKNYKDSVDISNLYIFYKKYNQDRIIVYADSYLEAKNLILAFYSQNSNDNEYCLTEYVLQKVMTDKLFKIMDIDRKEYEGYPFIVNEYEYNKLLPYIINKSDSKINHNKVLTQEIAERFGGGKSMPSSEEFIDALKETAIYNDRIKQEIKQMLLKYGDVWFMEIRHRRGAFKASVTDYVYGKSRLQCKTLAKDIGTEFELCNVEPKLLIKEVNYISKEDIENYKNFITNIRNNNAKKLPFTTNNCIEDPVDSNELNKNIIENI